MGQRYAEIARSMGCEVDGIDIGEALGFRISPGAAIVATPTPAHFDWCMQLEKLGIPYLCEKPIAMENIGRLYLLKHGYCVNNWSHVFEDKYLEPKSVKEVHYDCSHTGPHGRAWDCIQLYHLAKTMPQLKTESKDLVCTLDGRTVTREHIAESYRRMLHSFINLQTSRLWSIHSTIGTHRLVKFILGGKQNGHSKD